MAVFIAVDPFFRVGDILKFDKNAISTNCFASSLLLRL
jgi:hypothetical protein